jgi:Fic family protein
MDLLLTLQQEKQSHLKGGLYHQTQIKMAYNSNRIEGSHLTQEQTRYIFETNSINTAPQESANIDDILETINHFACFDFMLDIAGEPLSQLDIKEFHSILKQSTSDSKKEWFRVGDYKAKPNMVGDTPTTAPENVVKQMLALLESYESKPKISLEDIINFHYQFEKIHPFQDGNGRVGRMIMFKECLRHKIMPFIIEDEYKLFYYRGLREFGRTQGYLLDTCRRGQDIFEVLVGYFYPV